MLPRCGNTIVRVGSSMLVVREHVAAGQQIFRPGDEVRLEVAAVGRSLCHRLIAERECG